MTTPAIEAVDVTRVYSLGGAEVQALRGVSLRVEPGEYAAIVGPSGSGKSTLMHLLGLLDRPSSGVITVGGRDATSLSDSEMATLRNETIGFVFQSFQLLSRTTAIDNVALPLLYRGVAKGERRERAEAALAAVGLSGRTGHKATELSGGEQQRVALARALAPNPKLVFADEPTGNLDAANGASIVDSLFTLTREQAETTLILVTHDIQLAERCDRIIDLRDGKICESNGA